MNLIDIQAVCPNAWLPEPGQLQQWVDAALDGYGKDTEITVRIVDEAESAELNSDYRHKSGPTNILSFPFEPPDLEAIQSDFLGDLVVCAPVLAREAQEQQKALSDHWAHIIVHGLLHLLGYDHIEDADAAEMETLEITILSKLNIRNPYIGY